MQYNNRHKHCQYYILNLLKHVIVELQHSKVIFAHNYLFLLRLRLIPVTSKYLSKLVLALMPLLLLPYATTTQALSATTVQVINGNQPYLTFDNGVTKVTTTESLLGITISDGTIQTTYTLANNTSTASNPIELLKENQSFADIGMLIPSTTDSITLNELIGAPNNYWGDEDGDGDGQGTNGITATGNLSVTITDNMNNEVSRNTVLSICNAPYKVKLTSTSGSLITQYGVPNSSRFSGSSAIYYISPKSPSKICYARPNLSLGYLYFTGPATIWNKNKGFLVQSTKSSNYNRNFPTTGANNLYFDLDIVGINGSTLTWPTISQGGITATMMPSPDDPNNIRVTLTGPGATMDQQWSATPGSIATPTLPQTFVLVGKDSSNTEVLKYGFVLKQWFVTRGGKEDSFDFTLSWCSKLGGGYRVPEVKDLTNAECSGTNSGSFCKGAVGATPSSKWNGYQRNIGAGFFTEWGNMGDYTDANFANNIPLWTVDSNGTKQFIVYTHNGYIDDSYISSRHKGVCTYP